MKLWGGRFHKDTVFTAQDFTASIPFDRRMYKQDINGSIAHVTMLAKCGIITADEKEKIIAGLQEIMAEIEAGKFQFKVELEDIHMNVEHALIEKIGPVGAKVHTARSRNDQAVLDTHMYLREEVVEIMDLINHLQETILSLAENNQDAIMPGYTHMQRAQPILFSHHLLTYFFRLQADWERLRDCYRRIDVCPLGAAALAGTTFPIDRHYSAELLAFSRVYENSIDAVSDRDFVIEFLADAAILAMHISRLNEELILWSTREFGFIEMGDAYSTGSSIMPQKKNPDVAELSRGKTGRVYGNLMSVLTMMKGLPLAFNSDMQEDKERLFDTIDTIKAVLAINAGMLAAVTVRKQRMREAIKGDFSNATDMADYLTRKGMPFRQAHAVVGSIVLHCIEAGKDLSEMSLAELREYSDLFADDVFTAIDPETCVSARISYGGTAPARVAEEIKRAKEILAADRENKHL
jgi:argininosuccinate lyase